MDAEEGLEKLRDAFRVLQCYKSTYHDRKERLPQYFGDKPVVLWEFQPHLVFSRLDKMIAQLRLIEVRPCAIGNGGGGGGGGGGIH